VADGDLSVIVAVIASSLAWAADEPCYGHTWDDRISGSQFWVEWDPTVIDAEKAQVILDAAEHARDVYKDELQWQFTDDPVVISVIPPQSGGGFAGLTRTQPCDDGAHPRIELFVGFWDDGTAVDITSHEVGHVAEYAYMGDYLSSVGSWLWWMEGVATWITPYADGETFTWADAANDFLGEPQMGLHHGLDGFLDPTISGHMYGSGYVAEYLDEFEGGPDAVRATWEYGATVTGTPIYFGDAIDGAGMDFDAVWTRYLVMTAGDGFASADLLDTAPRAAEVAALPASGSSDEDHVPQGLGFNLIHFAVATGDKKSALHVTFDGDPSVEWTAVLIRTNGGVVDYVPLEVTDGSADGYISGFLAVDGWLAVSPHSIDTEPHAYTWDADLIEDPGPAPGTVTLGTAPEHHGCDVSGGPGLGSAALAALIAIAGRRRASRP
jgi:hypothetical protein